MPEQNKPSIVFAHGIWADGSCFQKLIPTLRAEGHEVMAAQYGLDMLKGDVDATIRTFGRVSGPIVLVGHSYGGAVISNAAVGVPNVKALVYIAGFAPDKGESLIKLVTMNPGTMIGPKTLIQRKYPLAEGAEGTDLYLTKHGFETAFASDVPKKLADQMWAEQRPFSQATATTNLILKVAESVD